MRMVAWLMLSFCSLLLPAVLAPLFLFALRWYGLVAGRSAGYGGKEVESGRHVLGGAVLVLLLLPGGMFHFGGGLRQVNAFLPGEKVVEHACGELLAQTGAVEDGFGGNDTMQQQIDANYYRIKNEVRQIVADEIERIKADPELSHLIKNK